MLIPKTATAIMTQKVDSFDNTKAITSDFTLNGEVIKVLMFTKHIPKNKEPFYSVYFFTVKDEWWFYSNTNLEMKVDNKDEILSLPVVHTDTKIINIHSLMTSCVATVEPSIISKIANANEITFRIHFKNQPSHIFPLPHGVLGEWQKVIASQQAPPAITY